MHFIHVLKHLLTSCCLIFCACDKNPPSTSADSTPTPPVQALHLDQSQTTHPQCVTDPATGLTWEIKTDDDGEHDKDKVYRWGGIGAEQIGEKFYPDWNVLVNIANEKQWCGRQGWRVPTIDELKSLVDFSQSHAALNQRFSNIQAGVYWSVSAYTHYPEHAQTVHFATGETAYFNGYRGNSIYVRLVTFERDLSDKVP